MNDDWYEAVEATVGLTQGDFIFDCPISTWAEGQPKVEAAPSVGQTTHVEKLVRLREIISEDVVVMTQACDLENNHVSDVVLCPHYSLQYYRESIWKPDQERRTPPLPSNSEAWKKHVNVLRNGHIWNMCVVNSSKLTGLEIDHRVVDFHTVHTIPRDFLETLLQERGKSRLRLRPPYREHLSQAFARFFMRVGLPTALAKS